ncbi:MAG: hypothetical protein MUC63_02715 [Planctomycetes bacterium]|nr:hypothetical protein [Planctomycetota bacterium]
MDPAPEGFECSETASGRVHVSPAFREAVEALGLRRFSEALAYIGGATVDANRKRSVVRVEWGGRAFFLKRFTRPPAKDALWQLIRGRRPRTHAEVEGGMIRAFREAGLDAPEVAAWGEEAGRGLRRRSFLLTAGLPDALPLPMFLEENRAALRSPRARGAFAGALAGTVRRMHDAGLAHPDLYSYHVFVRGTPASPSFAFIDLHRAFRRETPCLLDAVRDLTSLHLTLPPVFVTRSDRVRFLSRYFGGGKLRPAGRQLARKILLRAKRVGGRGKFKALAERTKR